MRWFKHISASHTDETMSELTDNFGAEGYGVWWIILEKIAQVMDESDRCFARYSVKVWANSAKISAKKFQNITGFLQKKQSLILELDKDILTIKCPKLLKYRDEWTERKNKESKKSRDQLPSDSRETPAQDTELDTDTELDIKEKCPKVQKADISDDSCFSQFWTTYPKQGRQKKKRSKEIWVRKKLDSKLTEILMDVKQRSIEHAEWINGFIPHASTYLNGEYWNDEIVGVTETIKTTEPKTLSEKNDLAIQEFIEMRKNHAG